MQAELVTDKQARRFSNIGILCNPASGRVKKRARQFRELASTIPGAVYREASCVEEFEETLAVFADMPIDLLVIIAGDGTIHALLTIIFNRKIFPSIPCFSIIPAGTTNMTAKDFGQHGRALKIMHRLVAKLNENSQCNCVCRPVVRVEDGEGHSRYGFFFGTGVLADAVQYFQDNVKGTGITGEKASAMVFLRYMIRLVVKGGRTSEASRLGVGINGQPQRKLNHLLLLVTSLQRLLLGCRPYWGEQTGPLHLTMVADNPVHLLRSLYPLLSGNGGRLLEEDGYFSYGVSHIDITHGGQYVIDGELYSTGGEAGVLSVSANESVSVLDPGC